MHGAGGTGHDWLASDIGAPNFLMRLVERGYDVWVGNARGAQFSNENVQDGVWSLEERWNYTWADMGYYDLPANIDKIIDVTGKDKVTLMGASQGTS